MIRKFSISSCMRISFCIGATFLGTSALQASDFGSDGMAGRQGNSGRDGRSGQNLVIKAEGASASYDVSGSDGSDGTTGENGYNATSCFPPNRPAYDLTGANGGRAGAGGPGGDGGNGGALTVYFTDINNLKFITVHGTPGRGGSSNWGGRGGFGCRCSESSWTIPDSSGAQHSYTCRDGQMGSDAGRGSDGSFGSYGQVLLVSQMTPVLQDLPSVNIDMSKMETGPFTVSKNNWEPRRGAASLFASGTDISNSYYFFKDRVESTLKFRWEATRPLTDFARWQMQVKLEGTEAKVYFPDGLWVDFQRIEENGEKIFVIKAVVAESELPYIQFDGFLDEGSNHVISIKDSAGMANVLQNSIHAEFWTVVAGQWKQHFDGDLPADSLQATADHIHILMGRSGIDPVLFKAGTKAYVKLLVTRKLGGKSQTYQLASNYNIQIQLSVGQAVEVLQDSNLLIGNQIVGTVKKGDQFIVGRIQDGWIRLKKSDGTELAGWITAESLKKI
jgi:hypothetical protein